MSNSLGSIRGVVKNGQKCVEINSDIADVKGNLTVSGGDLKVGGTGIEHIQDIYGVTGEKAGGAVSLSNDGTIFAIGGDQFDGNGMTDNGRVRIFKYNGTTWTQLGNDIYGEQPGDKIGQGLYGGLSLSGDGFRVAIASAFNTTGGNNSQGQVRIFEYNQTDWIQLGDSIYGVTGDVNYEEAMAISLSGDGNVVAIGCAGQVNSGLNGKVRVFEYTGTAWSQLGSDILGPSNYGLGERGVDLSNNGTILSAGAWRHDNFRGCVRIYQYNSGSWSQLGSDIVGPNVGDNFAENSLSADGTIVAIGGINHDSNVSNTGIVQVYQYIGSAWTQIGSNIYGDVTNDGLTRPRLSKDGNTLLVSSSPVSTDLPVTSGLLAHYSWYSYTNASGIKTWEDLSGNGNHMVLLSSTGTSMFVTAENANMAGNTTGERFPYVAGNSAEGWDLAGLTGNERLSQGEWTIIHISRYDPGSFGTTPQNFGRILNGVGDNVLFGHWDGYVGSSFYGGWIGGGNATTFDVEPRHGSHWVFQVQRPGINGDSNGNNYWRTTTLDSDWTQISGGGNANVSFRPTLNDGRHGAELSDWNVAEIIIFDRRLTDTEVELFKTWLMDYKAGNIHGQYPFSSGNGDGYVKLFENIDSTWTEIGKITGDPNLHNNGQLRFGMSSALSGDGRTFAAGSPYADIDNNTDTGIAKIYQYNKKGNLTTGRIQFFQTNTEVAGGDTASILNRFNTVINIPTTDSDGNALTADTTYEMTTGPAGSINNISFKKKHEYILSAYKTDDQNLHGYQYSQEAHGFRVGVQKNTGFNVGDELAASNARFVWQCPANGFYHIIFEAVLEDVVDQTSFERVILQIKEQKTSDTSPQTVRTIDWYTHSGGNDNPRHISVNCSTILEMSTNDEISFYVGVLTDHSNANRAKLMGTPASSRQAKSLVHFIRVG